MANDNSSIAFSIYQGGKLTREVSFDRAIINIGKLSTSNLRLSDVNSSRKHAVVERLEDGSWRATDLGSTNGTSLNGKRITQEGLRDGDRLLIGNTTLVVRLQAFEGEASSAAPRRRAEEIQGLGEDSFYSASEDEYDASDMVLVENRRARRAEKPSCNVPTPTRSRIRKANGGDGFIQVR